MLWTGAADTVSESFRELLLELAQERSLAELLPLVVRRLTEHEDIALGRLWLLAPGDQCRGCSNAPACADRTVCLHLVASAARPRGGLTVVDAHAGSAFRRIPVGAFKVGQVAATGAPVLVTDPARDPKIRRPDWIRAQGIAAFAGLPLVSRGQLIGVLGVFVRAPLGPAAVDVLRILANHAAAAIGTARAFAEVEGMRHRLLVENQLLRQTAGEHVLGEDLDGLVGQSPALRALLREIEAVAPTDSTVLISGESGTGKELVARAIHARSPRLPGPFVELNCAAIPRELSESELFGHVKGAFSGAVRDRVGRFEAASGGTLFLDEIGELPLDLQGKLLRVLQERSYHRVGEVRLRRADVRLVAATNRDLAADVAAGRFRQDLYYRLAVYPLEVPPLRARREDLPALCTHLLARICRRLHRPPVTLTADQIEQLGARAWPGNVRQLINVLERAVIAAAHPENAGRLRLSLAEAGRYDPLAPAPAPPPVAVPALEGPRVPQAPLSGPAPVLTDAEMRRRERDNLRRALERCGGRIYGRDGAAALLGLKPTTLASRLKRAGLPPA